LLKNFHMIVLAWNLWSCWSCIISASSWKYVL